VLAAADALRGRGGESRAPAETAAVRPQPNPELVRRLRAEGLSGTLVAVDAACRARTISLPGLAVSARAEGSCAVDREPVEPLSRLSAAELRLTGVAEPDVLDHVALSPTRSAVLLRWPGGGYVLGLYEERELLVSHRWGGEAPGRLVGAPGGALFAARPARVFRRDGAPVTLAPRFRNARAVAWSPDGSWTALAMGAAVVLVPTHALVGGAEAQRAIRLPYPARDLAWAAP
jgi:hypothetical protein